MAKKKNAGKRIANPKGNPQYLIPGAGGGRKPASLENFPPRWEKFCTEIVFGTDPPDAAEKAGMARDHGAVLLKRDLIKQRIQQIREKGEPLILEKLAELAEKTVITFEMLQEVTARIFNSGPHYTRGYADHMNGIRIWLEVLLKIQGKGVHVNNTNSAQAQAAAAVAAGREIPHFFVPPWKKAMLEAKTINAAEPGMGRGE